MKMINRLLKVVCLGALVLGSVACNGEASKPKYDHGKKDVRYVIVDEGTKEQASKAKAALLLTDEGELVVLGKGGEPAESCTREPGPAQCEIFKKGVKVSVDDIESVSITEYQVNPFCFLICFSGCYEICY